MRVQEMDCRNWDEDLYRDAILQDREALSRTVFRTIFVPNHNPNSNSDHIVTATSDGSIEAYSISSCLEMGCGSAMGQNFVVAKPFFTTRGHDGPAYDVKFYDGGCDSLLLSCGDDGRIRGWKWKDIVGSEMAMSEGELKPVIDLVNPQHKGPWGALSPIPENNAIAVDSQSGSVYAAAGDSCAYCWDMEKCMVKTVFKGHSNYLQCVVSCTLSSQVITGSEDGTARIWDCKSGRCIKVITPDIKNKLPCVSCIALDSSESWLLCGKGQSLSVWNLPARECISRTSMNTPIQDVVYDENQILAVGAEPVLTRLNMNGDILSQIHCAPPSIFSVSLHRSGVTSVSGYGGLVDIISQFGSHLCTFRCRSC